MDNKLKPGKDKECIKCKEFFDCAGKPRKWVPCVKFKGKDNADKR